MGEGEDKICSLTYKQLLGICTISFMPVRPLQFIYLSYELRRQEMSHLGIKKKVEKCDIFFFF